MDPNTTLDDLIKAHVPDLGGMKPDAAWDAVFMLDAEDRDFGVMLSWYYACFIEPKEEDAPKEG